MDTRVCIYCGQEKEATEFNFKNKRKGIRHVRCQDCTREQIREHYRANRHRYITKAKV